MKSKRVVFRAMTGVIAATLISALSGCGESQDKDNEEPTVVSVSVTKRRMGIWNRFSALVKDKEWKPVVLYTRKKHPVKRLDEITNKDEVAVCKEDEIHKGVVLLLIHYEGPLLKVDMSVAKPDTLEPSKRLFLGYEEWEKELNSHGWVRIQLVER